MSAGGNLSKTPFSMINATKAIKRSLSRENTPISVKSQLDFNEVEEIPITPRSVSKMKTPRKLAPTNQKGELLGSITTRRSVRFSNI